MQRRSRLCCLMFQTQFPAVPECVVHFQGIACVPGWLLPRRPARARVSPLRAPTLRCSLLPGPSTPLPLHQPARMSDFTSTTLPNVPSFCIALARPFDKTYVAASPGSTPPSSSSRRRARCAISRLCSERLSRASWRRCCCVCACGSPPSSPSCRSKLRSSSSRCLLSPLRPEPLRCSSGPLARRAKMSPLLPAEPRSWRRMFPLPDGLPSARK